jgi:hypothetical protein
MLVRALSIPFLFLLPFTTCYSDISIPSFKLSEIHGTLTVIDPTSYQLRYPNGDNVVINLYGYTYNIFDDCEAARIQRFKDIEVASDSIRGQDVVFRNVLMPNPEWHENFLHADIFVNNINIGDKLRKRGIIIALPVGSDEINDRNQLCKPKKQLK